jgi:hypothetical protein
VLTVSNPLDLPVPLNPFDLCFGCWLRWSVSHALLYR